MNSEHLLYLTTFYAIELVVLVSTMRGGDVVGSVPVVSQSVRTIGQPRDECILMHLRDEGSGGHYEAIVFDEELGGASRISRGHEFISALLRT